MSDLCFDVWTRWSVDEYYGEYLHIFERSKGTTPILVLDKQQMTKLIETWNEKRSNLKVRKQI